MLDTRERDILDLHAEGAFIADGFHRHVFFSLGRESLLVIFVLKSINDKNG